MTNVERIFIEGSNMTSYALQNVDIIMCIQFVYTKRTSKNFS